MILLTPNTPFLARQEHLHGQGTLSYTEYNGILPENISPQSAPDPIRQGDTPARPSRRTFAFMQLNLLEWGMGLAGDFLVSGVHGAIPQPSRPFQTVPRAQNSVGGRPNLTKPAAIAYGSLFSLNPPVYDVGTTHG